MLVLLRPTLEALPEPSSQLSVPVTPIGVSDKAGVNPKTWPHYSSLTGRMSLEISVGPPQLAINEGNLVLLTELDGRIAFPSEKGLYFYDTRLIGSWSILANGQSWELLNSANIGHYASRIFLTNPELTTQEGSIPRHSLGLAVGRSLGEGMHEDQDLDVANYGSGPAHFNLEFAIRCDFADLFEVKANKIVRRGRITTPFRDCREVPDVDRTVRGSRRGWFSGICHPVACRLREPGWKDPGDALVDLDGSPVKGPKAPCELQGYAYEAWTRMAEVCVELGKLDRAKELRAKAAALMERFDRAFWDEEAGFYAFALDGDKKKVMSVASNAGQCLWSGIVPVERARKVVARLMQPDMRSGWGIRKLSSQHPAFNPYSYQKGSVWPHDNGLIALGFRRYGFDREASLIMQELLGAGGFFDHHQMPELYAGVQRTPSNFPVHYLGTNVPQAWAAGTIFMLLRMILGFQPDAPYDKLCLDPLPEWRGARRVEGLGFAATKAWADGGHEHLRPDRVAPVSDLFVNEPIGVLAQ